jgi:hypothetical protein
MMNAATSRLVTVFWLFSCGRCGSPKPSNTRGFAWNVDCSI